MSFGLVVCLVFVKTQNLLESIYIIQVVNEALMM